MLQLERAQRRRAGTSNKHHYHSFLFARWTAHLWFQLFTKLRIICRNFHRPASSLPFLSLMPRARHQTRNCSHETWCPALFAAHCSALSHALIAALKLITWEHVWKAKWLWKPSSHSSHCWPSYIKFIGSVSFLQELQSNQPFCWLIASADGGIIHDWIPSWWSGSRPQALAHSGIDHKLNAKLA